MAEDLIALTGFEAAERVHAGELDPADLWRAYRERSLADELNAYTWVSDAAEPEEVPAGGSPRGCASRPGSGSPPCRTGP